MHASNAPDGGACFARSSSRSSRLKPNTGAGRREAERKPRTRGLDRLAVRELCARLRVQGAAADRDARLVRSRGTRSASRSPATARPPPLRPGLGALAVQSPPPNPCSHPQRRRAVTPSDAVQSPPPEPCSQPDAASQPRTEAPGRPAPTAGMTPPLPARAGARSAGGGPRDRPDRRRRRSVSRLA